MTTRNYYQDQYQKLRRRRNLLSPCFCLIASSLSRCSVPISSDTGTLVYYDICLRALYILLLLLPFTAVVPPY